MKLRLWKNLKINKFINMQNDFKIFIKSQKNSEILYKSNEIVNPTKCWWI